MLKYLKRLLCSHDASWRQLARSFDFVCIDCGLTWNTTKAVPKNLWERVERKMIGHTDTSECDGIPCYQVKEYPDYILYCANHEKDGYAR